MNRGSKGALPKGQPSIRGFFTSKAAPAPKIVEEAAADHIADAPAAEERPAAAVSLEEEKGATPEQAAGAPAPKRARAAPSPPSVSAAGPSAAAAAAPRAPHAPAPPADPAARRARWQAKLLGDESGLRGRGGARSQAAVDAAERPPPTPLEEQVAALQAAHPDCLLAFEVGYKFRFFGRDAEAASACLGILAYPDRNFLAVSAGRLP
jgi:hypothetical protein